MPLGLRAEKKLMRVKQALAFVAGVVTGWTVTRKLLRKADTAIKEKTNNELAMLGQENKPAIMGMRKFSEREQRAILRMIDGTASSYSFVLVNIYNDIYFSRSVEFCYGKDKSHLVFYRADPYQVSHDELLEIENEIMEISLLISYLQTNGLIYLIENTSDNELNTAGGFMKDGLSTISMELDSNVARILFDSLNHRVFVGYTLRELARRFRGEGVADRAIFGERPSLFRELAGALRETLRDWAYLAKSPRGWCEIPSAPVRRLVQRLSHYGFGAN